MERSEERVPFSQRSLIFPRSWSFTPLPTSPAGRGGASGTLRRSVVRERRSHSELFGTRTAWRQPPSLPLPKLPIRKRDVSAPRQRRTRTWRPSLQGWADLSLSPLLRRAARAASLTPARAPSAAGSTWIQPPKMCAAPTPISPFWTSRTPRTTGGAP